MVSSRPMIVLGYGERKLGWARRWWEALRNYCCLGAPMVELMAADRRETTRRASDAARRRKLDPIQGRGLLKPRGESVETTPQTSEITD